MKITFLGTGTSQGIPVISSKHPVCLSNDKKDKRLRSSLLIQWKENSYVIDCGPDFRYQMLRENVLKVNGVLLTHEHADHSMGLDDLRPFSYQFGAVPVYAQKKVHKKLKKRFDYIFKKKNKYPGAPNLEQIKISLNPFYLDDLKITPVEIMHGKLKIFGFKFKNIAYLTDIKTITEKEKKKLKNLDILIINCIRYKFHHSHLNYDEALELIDDLKPKKTYLTHISHLLGFHSEVEKKLPKNVNLAFDGLSILV